MYLQGYASIRHMQRLYQVQLAGSTKHPGFSQVDLIFKYFYSDKVSSLSFFAFHVAHQTDIDIRTNQIHVVHFPLEMFQISLA